MESCWNIGCPLRKHLTPSVMKVTEWGASERETISFEDWVQHIQTLCPTGAAQLSPGEMDFSLTKPPLTCHLVKACVRFSWKAVLVNYWPGRPDHKHFPMWNMNLAELEYCSQKAWSFPAPHQPQCPSKSTNEGLMLQLHLYKYRYQNTVKHGLKNSLQNPQPKLLQLWFWQTRKFNILWNSMLLTSGYIIITKVTFLQRILKSGILPKKKIRRLGVENRKVFLQRTLSCITS